MFDPPQNLKFYVSRYVESENRIKKHASYISRMSKNNKPLGLIVGRNLKVIHVDET